MNLPRHPRGLSLIDQPIVLAPWREARVVLRTEASATLARSERAQAQNPRRRVVLLLYSPPVRPSTRPVALPSDPCSPGKP